MLHAQTEDTLLLALFAASTTPVSAEPGGSSWVEFLENLRAVTQADSASLQLTLTNGHAFEWHVGQAATLDETQRQTMRDNRVYAQIDLPGTSHDHPPLRAVKTPVGSQGVAVLVLRRETRDFRAVDSSRLSVLLPYLGPAFVTWLTLAKERYQAAKSEAIAHALNTGWIAFDTTGIVRQMGSKARDLIDASDAVRLQPTGRLAFSEGAVAQAFRRGIAGLVAGDQSSICIDLTPEPLTQLMLSVEDWMGEPVILGVLRQALSARERPIGSLIQTFDLSRSEARLAALICDGVTLRQAAQHLGWTEETARSCSKKIFAQLHVNGQTGLIRKMQNSAVWFEPAL